MPGPGFEGSSRDRTGLLTSGGTSEKPRTFRMAPSRRRTKGPHTTTRQSMCPSTCESRKTSLARSKSSIRSRPSSTRSTLPARCLIRPISTLTQRRSVCTSGSWSGRTRSFLRPNGIDHFPASATSHALTCWSAAGILDDLVEVPLQVEEDHELLGRAGLGDAEQLRRLPRPDGACQDHARRAERTVERLDDGLFRAAQAVGAPRRRLDLGRTLGIEALEEGPPDVSPRHGPQGSRSLSGVAWIRWGPGGGAGSMVSRQAIRSTCRQRGTGPSRT